ncbi:MASE1 domain-containing protein [Chryseolinea lacunae]|uniref:histidine kinase n=1 Tax=Chryseolinea lacunae TaxID=2801331 RepID=A0ABS1KT81_9BACT|nr:MASE1 domain-containing protein [Chryseolinea lacunae]MBL0742422.1 MASE1 domain-containing protein [Chryseolinea lacunae]
MNVKLPLKYKLDLKIIGVALLYYLSARLGYFFAFEGSTALPAWPPSGIGFALIILLGRSSWPGITIGSLVANVMAYWNDPHLPAQVIIGMSSLIAVGNTVEALLGNYLVKVWIKDDFPFKNAKNAFRFLFVTLIMCWFGAGIGMFGLYLNNLVLPENLLRVGISGWVGNVVGILLFTPFFLACSKKPQIRFTSEKAIEVGIFVLCMTGIVLLLQIDYLLPTLERALPFLVLPFLLWLAFRFDLIVAIVGVVATALMSIYMTVTGVGPFVLSDSYNSMLLLQIFIGVISITTIILSATVKERQDAQSKLLEFNENLESMVAERTRALNEEISTRKEAEEKIQRTNHELSKRNTELDNFVYSVSHDLRAPIASVLGLINLAKKDIDTDMKDMYLDMINKSALQQDHFIKEILDQSRNSRLEVKREEIQFEPLIDETFNQLKFATSTGQSVQKVIHITQEGPFFSDRWRLKVILNNIISNAIRYRNGKDPVIKVNVEIKEHLATLAIEDNGKGIDKDHLPNVYKMFYRATDDGAGSGLGLYIVKEAIDKLNGHIDIESEVGRGTTVTLAIPELI